VAGVRWQVAGWQSRKAAKLQSCRVAGLRYQMILPRPHPFILSSCHPVSSPTPTAVPTATPIPAATPVTQENSNSLNLSTEEQLAAVIVPTRDLRDLALRLLPDVGEIPVVVNLSAPNYAVGDRIEFWAHDLRENNNFQITAELIYKSDNVYAWVETGQSHEADKIIPSVERFSRATYPAEIAFFGNEWNPGIDNDPRLHILHVTGVGSGVAGYYSSADQYSQKSNPFSNEKEMFYINLDWLNRSRNYQYYETVLAHELQHMIHWRNDRNEETWVNEGLSEFSQEVADYEPDTVFVNDFMDQPDTQLNTWGLTPGQNGEHYGSSYLFMSYFAQRFGTEAIKTLVAHPANGIAGFKAVLPTIGYANDFDQLFGEWIVANYIDVPNALGQEGTYGYQKIDPGQPLLDATYTTYPQSVSSDVHNYAADYIRLENDQRSGSLDLTVQFSGQSSTQLVDARPYSGRMAWWSSRGDDSDTRLTRQWDILAGQRTTDSNPSGNSFGRAYTGHSTLSRGYSDEYPSEWVTERYDLSPYAGQEVWIRFEYVTDDAVSDSGWLIDDIQIPALGYATDFEDGADGWESEGWLLTDNQLAQRWLIQVLRLDSADRLQAVEQIVVNDAGDAVFQIDDLSSNESAVLTISGLAPVTTETAPYTMAIRQTE